MTDAEHAAVLRSSIDALRLGKHERAAIERAIELLEREARSYERHMSVTDG